MCLSQLEWPFQASFLSFLAHFRRKCAYFELIFLPIFSNSALESVFVLKFFCFFSKSEIFVIRVKVLNCPRDYWQCSRAQVQEYRWEPIVKPKNQNLNLFMRLRRRHHSKINIVKGPSHDFVVWRYFGLGNSLLKSSLITKWVQNKPIWLKIIRILACNETFFQYFG